MDQCMEQRMKEMEKRLNNDLAQHVKSVGEWFTDQLKVVDDKYADLPERVNRLESTVFTAKRR
jgi:ubiquinone biosynthesis protein UbiJ